MTNLVAPGLIGASLPFITSTLNSRRAGGKSPRLVSGAGQWATSSIHRKYCTIDYAIRMRGDGFYCVKVSDASRRNSLGRFDDTEFAQRRGLVGNVGENRAGGDDIDGGVRDIGQLISVWGADWLLGTAGSIHGIAYRKDCRHAVGVVLGLHERHGRRLHW